MVNVAPVSSAALPAFEAAQANLGALQIEQNPGVHARLARSLADCVDARGVIVLRAVRGVEAEYIDAGGEELVQDSRRIGGRPQSGYNFCVGHPVELSCQTGRGLRGAVLPGPDQLCDILVNRVERGVGGIGGGRQLLDR